MAGLEFSRLDFQLAELEKQITEVDMKLRDPAVSSDPAEKQFYRKKEEQLRKKEEQLREERLILLRQAGKKMTFVTEGGMLHGVAATSTCAHMLLSISAIVRCSDASFCCRGTWQLACASQDKQPAC